MRTPHARLVVMPAQMDSGMTMRKNRGRVTISGTMRVPIDSLPESMLRGETDDYVELCKVISLSWCKTIVTMSRIIS